MNRDGQLVLIDDLRLYFVTLYDWAGKLVPVSRPMRFRAKLTATWSLAFSCTSESLLVFVSSTHWLRIVYFFLLISNYGCSTFGLPNLKLNGALLRSIG